MTGGRATVCTLLFLQLILFVAVKTVEDLEQRDDKLSSSRIVEEQQQPLVFLAVIARNVAHLFPNYMGYLERMNYPKKRISVSIYTDHNSDNTSSLLMEWSSRARSVYHSIHYNEETEWLYTSTEPFEWHTERVRRMCQLRQEALKDARELNAEYILYVDSDNFIVNPETLNKLIEAKKPIVAPLLIVDDTQAFSNFWAGQDENGYYVRTDEYIPILNRERKGCFKVPLVHCTYLIDLRTEASKSLAYWPAPKEYKWDLDDIILFSYSARKNGVGMYVLNTEYFGHLMKPWVYTSLEKAAGHFLYWKLKTIASYPPLPVSEFITLPPRQKDNCGLDAVYMISLLRRPERRNRMLACLDELGFDYTPFDAIDGRQLNESYIKELGISYMPGWKDPWGERPMTFGEVGCFLSHYFIWLKIIAEDWEKILILEDDIDFEDNFRHDLMRTLREVENADPEWDLVYIGRKSLNTDDEKLVEGTEHLVIPMYSYWTLGYIISQRGAKKLLSARPFDNLLPVDEYIPILYDQHPFDNWVKYFPNRNLHAYSAEPLLIFPTHYVGDKEWFSDTEPPENELAKIRARKEQEEEEQSHDTTMKTEL